MQLLFEEQEHEGLLRNGGTMNRAERRRLAKAEQKKAQEKALAIKPSELVRYRQDCLEEAITGNAEVLFNCFALAMHEQCGFGRTRINRVLAQTDEYFGLLAHDKMDFSEIQRKLYDEVGLEIGMED